MYKFTLRAILVSITVIGASCSTAFDSALVDSAGQQSPLEGVPADPNQAGESDSLTPNPASPGTQTMPTQPPPSGDPGIPQLDPDNPSPQPADTAPQTDPNATSAEVTPAPNANPAPQGDDLGSCIVGKWVGDTNQVASQLGALVQQIEGASVTLGASTMVANFGPDGSTTISAAADISATVPGFGTYPGQAASSITGTWGLSGNTLSITTSSSTLTASVAGQQLSPRFGPAPGTPVSGTVTCSGNQLTIQGGNGTLFTPVNWTRTS